MKLIVYTRREEEGYSAYLGHSVHFALHTGEGVFPLFRGYGKLFAPCAFSAENGIVSRGVRDLSLQRVGAEYRICGRELVRIKKSGRIEEEYTGRNLCWTTEDFRSFDGPVPVQDDPSGAEKAENALPVPPDELCPYMEAAVRTDIPDTLADRLLRENGRVRFSSAELPETVEAASMKDLEKITATVRYSDGSEHNKRILWDDCAEAFARGGEFTAHGRIRSVRFPFPVELHPWGDPVIGYLGGKYYFIATDDTDGSCSFKIREADSPEALFSGSARQAVLLDADHSRFERTFWAPEFHRTGGRLRIFCALTERGRCFDPQAHVMTLGAGGDPMNPSDWSEPVRCVMPDGRYLNLNPLGDGKNGITLDMTAFEAGGALYAVWSYRTWEGCDSGSMLMIARIDPDEPWKLTTFPRLLSRPVFGWEHNKVTDNNEGPYAIVTDKKVFLTYSSGSAAEDTYAVGLLTASVEDDLCCGPDEKAVWTKSTAPVLASEFVAGQYGCGHNAFFTDEYGDLFITYHAHDTLSNPSPRLVGIRRVHTGADGEPVFDMSEEEDLPRSAEAVSLRVRVVKK